MVCVDWIPWNAVLKQMIDAGVQYLISKLNYSNRPDKSVPSPSNKLNNVNSPSAYWKVCQMIAKSLFILGKIGTKRTAFQGTVMIK
jgi:hypothetical protein